MVSCLRAPPLYLTNVRSVLSQVIYLELHLYHGHFQCSPILKLHCWLSEDVYSWTWLWLWEKMVRRSCCANALNSLHAFTVEHSELLPLSGKSFPDLPVPLVLWKISLLCRYFDAGLRELVGHCFPQQKLSEQRLAKLFEIFKICFSAQDKWHCVMHICLSKTSCDSQKFGKELVRQNPFRLWGIDSGVL